MTKVVKKKEQINATVSPWLKKRCTEIAQGPDFSSVSDVVSQALSEFIAKYDDKKAKETKKYEETITELLIHALMQTKNGQECLESMGKSNKMIPINNEKLDYIKVYDHEMLQKMLKSICDQKEESPSTEK